MKCNKCAMEFLFGNRPDGLPNGVGFQLEDGRMINICAECLTALGGMTLADKQKFFAEMDVDQIQ